MFDVVVSPERAVKKEIARTRIGVAAYACQRTVKSVVSFSGVGLHSGTPTRLTLRPAQPGSGIRFLRSDRGAIIPALWSNVIDTRMNTCLGNEDGVSVRTVEHLMSALAGLGIDNVLIEIDGEEVPVMDGSAAVFVDAIERVGIADLPAPRQAIKVLKRIEVRDGNKSASLSPADGFILGMDIDFAQAAIGRQRAELTLTPAAFKAEISRARTFGFEQEVEAMRAAGLGRGGSLDNAVVISGDGSHILNEDGLRYDDEFVRHKILDAVGDMALAGAPLLARFSGCRTGHALNNKLLHALFADASAWIRVPQGVAGSISLPSLDRNSRLVAAAS